MAREADRTLRTGSRGRISASLATVAAVAILGSLVATLAVPSPPRAVSFPGGADDEPSCHGAAVWTGEVAWATCDWYYRDRALVELDPETARAKVLHRWRLDDGNLPELRIVRPCEDGRVFVIGETKQTTVVVKRGPAITGSVVDVPGNRVLGARCDAGGVELFTGDEGIYSLVQAKDGRVERRAAPVHAALPGRIAGAWFEGDRWHVVVRSYPEEVALSGPSNEKLVRIEAVRDGQAFCLLGEPGGWLCTEPAYAPAALGRVDGAFRLTSFGGRGDRFVLHSGGGDPVGFTIEASERVRRFRGIGPLELELAEESSAFRARRAGRPNVTVARASASPLLIGPWALPLGGERVAIWGGLGSELIILGPELKRLDAYGPIGRVFRPFGKFEASTMSVLDQIRYFGVLIAACVWLVLLLLGALGRWKPDGRRLRNVALIVLALFAVGIGGFFEVVSWI